MESVGAEISWPSRKPREKQARVHNHHVSLRDRIKELSHRKHPKAGEQRGGDHEETSKAVAWAVFQHHGEGGVGHGHTHGMAVRRPTRFKIEAQMKHEVAHRTVHEEQLVAVRWDAGSTLFDSFELNSLLKTLDEAAHAPPREHADEEDLALAMVVHAPSKSPTHWSMVSHGDDSPRRLDETRPSESANGAQRTVRYSLTGHVKHGRHDGDDFSSPRSSGRRSFDSSKPAKGGTSPRHHHHHHHHHSRWKSLLHTLHLDGAAHEHHHGWKHLLHTLHLDGAAHGLFHKSHAQVAPHDLEKPRSRSSRKADDDLDRELYDGHFERNELHVAKDVDVKEDVDHHRHHHRHHHPHFWKFGLKTALTQPFCRSGHLLSDNEGFESEEGSSHKGHKKSHGHRHADLRAAWSSLTANLLHHHHEHKHEHEEHSVVEHHHHHHHHHHHVQPRGEDNEMTMQAISKRVARSSFDERTRRLSIEESGLKAPRNSLETPSVRA